jgi:hypothetical protein
MKYSTLVRMARAEILRAAREQSVTLSPTEVEELTVDLVKANLFLLFDLMETNPESKLN